MGETLPVHCKFLDGTDEVNCRWEGPYRHTRNKPSLGRIGHGPDPRTQHQFTGEILVCVPAEIARGATMKTQNAIPSQDTAEVRSQRYKDMAQAQSNCSCYKPLGT
jgi:hypothetical protein